jgi:ketosteroid isomerase-like protein
MTPDPRQVNQYFRDWLAAQNRHDFARYARMYAPDFVGVKRTKSGRKREYKRAAWLADRCPMMERSRHLHLSAEKVRVHVEDGAALISFDQFFRTRNYGDWGPKLLRLRANRSGLQIVHEELLASYPLPDEACC